MNEHHHPHTETKKIVDRISRASGHLDAIKKMVEDGRDCSEETMTRWSVSTMP